jgi:TolB-like protein/Tfp pilus assembly protein PilF
MPDKSLLQHLKERRLAQWAVAYLAGAWLVFQGVEVMADPWNLSSGLQRTLHLLLVIGFFVTLVLAWYHGEKGRQRVSGAELLMIAALLAIAAILLTIVRPEAEAPTTPYAGVVVEGERPAIAVLPFDNFSPNPDDAYFADGMHEEIIMQLSRISGIKVISRTSVIQYRETRPPARQIAGELSVGFLLEGSARKAEDQVRLTVQLIDAATDEHLWAEQYDRYLTAGNLFTIQSDVAEQVAATLEVELAASERERIEQHPTESLSAYDFYLLGRYHWNQLTGEGLRRAVEYFERALAQEPDFARAYTGLADSYMLTTQGWGSAPKEVFPKAREAATRALELDPTLAEAHASLGQVLLMFDWDWEGAETALKRAIELNPNYAPAHHWLALGYAARARHGDAIEEIRRALALDPQSIYVDTNMGYLLYVSRQYDRAAEHFRRAVEGHPESAVLHTFLGAVYAQQGKLEEAIAHQERARELSQGGMLMDEIYLGYTYGRAGRRDDAERLLDELHQLSSQRFVNPDYFAIVHLGLGENDRAIEWLYRAYEARTDWPIFFAVDPVTDSLQSDPRFKELLDMVGLSQLIR